MTDPLDFLIRHLKSMVQAKLWDAIIAAAPSTVVLVQSKGTDRTGKDDSHWLIRNEADGKAIAIMPCDACDELCLNRLRLIVKLLNLAAVVFEEERSPCQ